MYDGGEVLGQVRVERRNRIGLDLDRRGHRLRGGGTGERPLPGRHLIGNQPERELVRAVIERKPARLLG